MEDKTTKNNRKDVGDFLIIILSISLISLLMSLMAFYLSYSRIQGQEAGIWEGYMSMIPPTYITANFTPSFPTIGNIVEVTPLICNRFNGCIQCLNCTISVYDEIDGIKQSERKINLTNSSFGIEFNHNPTWIYMVLPNIASDWIRIPKPNFWQTINIMMKGYSFKIDGYIFLWTLISAAIVIITSIGKFLRWMQIKKLKFIQFLRITSNLIIKIIKKYWFRIIVGILLLIFIFGKTSYKLIAGGILLILVGLKQYFFIGLRDKKPAYLLWGVPVIYMGLISLLTNFLLPGKIDLFIFLVIFIFICTIVLYNYLMNYLNKVLVYLAFLILIYFIAVVTISINSSLIYINEHGFGNFYFYLGFIGFLILSTLAYFTLFRILFDTIKKYYSCDLFNNYFYLALATMSIILFSGFYYLQNLSQDKLRDFLIVISLAFVTSFAGVSAIKSLAKNKDRKNHSNTTN